MMIINETHCNEPVQVNLASRVILPSEKNCYELNMRCNEHQSSKAAPYVRETRSRVFVHVSTRALVSSAICTFMCIKLNKLQPAGIQLTALAL